MICCCQTHGYFREEECPECHEKIDVVLNDTYEKALGQFVSGVLRHFPEKAGLSMYTDGWVSFNSLTTVCFKKYAWFRKEHLQALIEVDKNRRYERSGGKVRARYGHSINVVLNYPDFLSPQAYYGVSEEEFDIVLENGLQPIKQRYVHLSTTYEKAQTVGAIHTENPILLSIDVKSMQKDGHKIMRVNEEIALTKYVPPEYIKKI